MISIYTFIYINSNYRKLKIIKKDVILTMAVVRKIDKNKNELTLEQMLKKFKQQVEKDGDLKLLRKREFYMSKSQKRRAKQKENQRRLMKGKKKR